MTERSHDRLTDGLAALDRTPVDVSWTHVESRIDRAGDLDLERHGAAPSGVGRRSRGRRLLVAAVVLAAVGAAAAVAWPVDRTVPVRTGPGSSPTDAPTTAPATSGATSTSAADVTATTLPSADGGRSGAVEAWTGTEYLVWGGAGGGDGTGRADGWRFDPATGATHDIPLAPIAPRDEAAGAWTGTELIVCCGLPVGQGLAYDTASAAAYDPRTNTWRTLADPPPQTSGYTLGAVWTGTELFVVSAVQDDRYAITGLLLNAYDPATDTWTRRADPRGGDRFGHLVWSGSQLIVWTTGYTAPPFTDRGQLYDPGTDTWTDLPPLPEDHRPTAASAVWAGDQLVVWGNDKIDDTATVGYRWRPGDRTWRSMAPAPIAPVSWGEATPGSQNLAYDGPSNRVIVVSIYQGEDVGDARPLLAYDPDANTWTDLGTAQPMGYSQSMLLVGDLVLQAVRNDPVAFQVPS